MKSTTATEWREFLQFGTRTAKVATVRSGGRPHVAPVWFVLDGNELVFTTSKESIKGKNLLRDPQVMISVDDEQLPFAYVLIGGRAMVMELSAQELLPWTTRIASRYVGSAQAGAYGKRNAVEGELLVRLPLTNVSARKGIAEW